LIFKLLDKWVRVWRRKSQKLLFASGTDPCVFTMAVKKTCCLKFVDAVDILNNARQ